MAPPTVLSLKQSFITAQSQALAATPSPSPAWLDSQAADSTSLPPRAVEDALYRLSHVIQQHLRRVHAPQATRHVAEQIDQLYWQGAEQPGRDEEGDSGVVSQGADLSQKKVIEGLPKTWEDQAAVEQFPAEAQRYSVLAERLSVLDAERSALLARVERLRRIRASLAPFAPQPKRPRSDAGDDDDEQLESAVQENLVTRNSEMERELERMRVLLARVGGRVGKLNGSGEGTEVAEDVDRAERRKMEDLLESL